MKRVLIVDDAAFMRAAIRNILTSNGFDVVGEAENGVVAIDKYQELHPDIVTMDITMPEMDGIETVKRLTALDPGCKIVMLSAMGQERMVRDAIVAGAKNFIVKPFKEDQIVQTLQVL